MGKSRKKAPSTSKEAKKKEAESTSPQEKKSKWQEYLNRHGVPKRSEEES